MMSDSRVELAPSRNAVVAGDTTLDWNLSYTRASGRSSLAGWDIEDRTSAYGQPGGAGLVGALLNEARKHAAAGSAPFEVAYPKPPDIVLPADPHYHHTYSIWSLFPYETPKRSPDDDRQAWRVDRYLGADRRTAPQPENAMGDGTGQSHAVHPDVLVLDDANLGFRDEPRAWPWKTGSVSGDPTWIVHKMAAPIAEGPLWEEVRRTWSMRVVAVMNANDLRLSAVQISRELSWERTAQDLLWELVNGQKLRALSECAHVVVSFGPVGALLLTRSASSSSQRSQHAHLFFDRGLIEGMWGPAHPGGMIGYTSCLTASIVCQLLWSPEQPDTHLGILRGLESMRVLHRSGYGQPKTADHVELPFPYDVVAAEFSKAEPEFAVVEVPVPPPVGAHGGGKSEASAESWSILQERYQAPLNEVAEKVAQDGAKERLKDVPFAEFGDLLTIDRREIESFRSIRTLIGEYLRHSPADRPLSIAVFGAPGSGKSFGIVEVSKSLPAKIKKLDFNLSQFISPDDLVGALHQVRDVGLAGDVPLVFWDEFDSNLGGKELGWLRYFLAPMQDGKFQSGELTHSIGKAVFVFAGGTAERMEQFHSRGNNIRRRAPTRATRREPAAHMGAVDAFKQAKGPDFVSRLKGYVNILGPNPTEGKAERDQVYPIRRAIYLRSVLKRAAPQLFEENGKGFLRIDPGVLRAFIRTKEYRHGIRSMEAIVSMSLLADKSQFVRSSLPSSAQLNLHVDGRDFLGWLQYEGSPDASSSDEVGNPEPHRG